MLEVVYGVGADGRVFVEVVVEDYFRQLYAVFFYGI